MAEYLLLLRDEPATFADLSPEEIQRIIEKYSAWAARLGEAEILVGGQKLADGEGRVMHKAGDAPGLDGRVTDGPFSEAKEVVGGYFLVRAESYDEAVEIARECPHVDYGSIEIRRVDDV